MNTINKFIFIIGIILVCCSSFAQNKEDKPSLAVLVYCDGGNQELAEKFQPLVEAEVYSQWDGTLVERAEIDKILTEQRLSAAGLLDRNTTIKIGKLLRADAFIILSIESPVPDQDGVKQSQESGNLIRVRVAETAHGSRLYDFFEQLDNANIKETVERIVQKIQTVIHKINQTDEKLIPVGIVDIHRVQLDERYRMLERTLPAVLSVRLSLEPKIIMLEREDLKVLLDEKLMTEGENAEFWNSAILIDGYIQPNNDKLELHLNLKQAASDILKSIIVPIDPNEAVAAIDEASIEIIKEINNSPPAAKWNPEKEAEQFYNKAQMLVAHGRNDEALPLFETAHALQPQNVFYTGTVFGKIWDTHRKNKEIEKENEDLRKRISETTYEPKIKMLSELLVEPSVYQFTDMELAEMASVLVRQIRSNYEEGKISSSDIYNNFAEHLGIEAEYTEYFLSSDSVATPQIKLINQENRKIYTDTFSKAIQKQFIISKWPETNEITMIKLAWISSDDPNTIITNIRNAFYKYAMPPELGGTINSFEKREKIFKAAFSIHGHSHLTPSALERSYLKGADKEYINIWHQFLWELAKNNDVLLSSKGALLLSQEIKNIPNESDKILAINTINNIIECLVDEITNSQSPLDNKEKETALYYIRIFVRNKDINDTASKTKLLDKITDYLIEQNNINGLADIVNYLPSFSPSTAAINNWRHQFMKKILSVLQGHETNVKAKRALVKINNNIGNSEDKHFQINTSSTKTDLSVSILLNQKGWRQSDQIYSLDAIHTTVQDNILWVALLSNDGSWKDDDNGNTFFLTNVLISGIDLEQKQEIIKWLAPVSDSGSSTGSIKNLLIGKKASYLTIQNGGILQFPGTDLIKKDSLENPKFLNHNNGLPSIYITSIAQYGDKLLVAYGNSNKESGLGIYDPVTEEWETIFCSTLQGEPPFSSGQTYKITSMLYENPDKLFLIVSELNEPDPTKKQLWKVNINTHKSIYIGTTSGEILKGPENNTWIKSSALLIKFDPVLESINIIMRNSSYLYRQYRNNWASINELNEDLFLPESFLKKVSVASLYTQGNLDLLTGTIHNNKLWSRYEKSKIIIAEKGTDFEESQIIDNSILDGKPVYKFVSTPYGVVGIGEGIVGLIEMGN